jgi:hypothetical protein
MFGGAHENDSNFKLCKRDKRWYVGTLFFRFVYDVIPRHTGTLLQSLTTDAPPRVTSGVTSSIEFLPCESISIYRRLDSPLPLLIHHPPLGREQGSVVVLTSFC